ncbi:hypothetical protein CA984_16345 [Streptosporangium minutum]|uniref:Uncharacterized protein n=1 Tax=Streptosporangium minutum TaxID=569862 RepID=A0A243RM66_9ACTN|nr:hypothetical protein CA984_16345 [Streptosporangium minutum]
MLCFGICCDSSLLVTCSLVIFRLMQVLGATRNGAAIKSFSTSYSPPTTFFSALTRSSRVLATMAMFIYTKDGKSSGYGFTSRSKINSVSNTTWKQLAR